VTLGPVSGGVEVGLKVELGFEIGKKGVSLKLPVFSVRFGPNLDWLLAW
jgi:hypothetical protein